MWYNTLSGHGLRSQPIQDRASETIRTGCGEEVLFVYDARRASVGVYVVPVTVCVHDHLTTGARDLNTPDFIKTNGAVQARLHPATFLPRLMVHAWRSSRSGGVGWRGYMNHALRGVFYACRHRVFCRKD